MVKNENRLGRGISSLLGERKINNVIDNVVGFSSGEKIQKISLQEIKPNSLQPRKFFNNDELDELSSSIKKYGVLQPIVVRKKNDYFEIIAGERRFRASQIAGLADIPAIIKEVTDEDVLTIAIIENIQRSNLNAIEEAESYNKLVNEFGYKHEDIANVVSKSRPHITNLIRLLKLPEDVRSLLRNNQITMGHARVLIDNEWASEIAQDIIQQGLSVRQVEILSKNYNNKPLTKTTTKKIDKNLKDYEDKFYKKFKLKSKIELGEDNNIKITIKSISLEDLQELLR
jgi:ParB family chromosome partitioning protein